MKVPFFVDLYGMNYRYIIGIFLFFNILSGFPARGQNPLPAKIRLSRITLLTQNFDSLTRSYLKKGFRIKNGKREPGGVFSNSIILQDGTEIILESTTSKDSLDWRVMALKKYGSYISGIAFETENLDWLQTTLKNNDVPYSSFTSYETYRTYLALDSIEPIDIVFLSPDSSSCGRDSLAYHRNHAFRMDWILLSASPVIETRIRKLFEITCALKQHGGCCDYWREGPPDDFCFFRFDPLPPKAKGKDNWLSIEPDGMYFAY